MGEHLDPNQMSERDRAMMGLGTRLETVEPDKDDDSWKSEMTDEEREKAAKETLEKHRPKGEIVQTKPGGRFANLEAGPPPGLSGKELEDWKAGQKRYSEETDESIKKENEERNYKTFHGWDS